MPHKSFPWLAAGIGLALSLVLLNATADARTEPLLPPLMLLFISELGFLVTVVGAWLGGRAWLLERAQLTLLSLSLACGGMALGFLYLGFALWSGLVPVDTP